MRVFVQKKNQEASLRTALEGFDCEIESGGMEGVAPHLHRQVDPGVLGYETAALR
jgi:hypothetical protein